MRPGRLRLTAATLLGAASCWFASRASAQAEPVRVSYRAPEDCPSEDAFLERVRSRTRAATFAPAGQLARAFDVTVSRLEGENGFLGRLEFVDSDGQHAARSLRGSACEQVASSLALITALAIDDRMAEAPPDDSSPLPSPPPAALSSPTPNTNPPPSAPPRLPEPPGGAAPASRGIRWELGLNAGLLTWITNSPARELGAYAELGSRTPSWSVRLSALDSRRNQTVDARSANFTTDWLRVEACPIAVEASSHFSLSPCAAFDVGQLRATADPSGAFQPTGPQSITWAAATALFRVSWVYRERLVFGWDGELGVPLNRSAFVFQAGTDSLTVLDVPKIGLGLKFGVGVRFP